MRCPVCKVENNPGPNCRRCKADLSLLFELERQRGHALTEARACLVRGAWRQAVERATRAHELRHDTESLRLQALASLLQRDYARTWAIWQQIRNATDSSATGVERDRNGV